MWRLYDSLIEGVVTDAVITEVIAGEYRGMVVNSEGGIGIAMNSGGARSYDGFVGMPVREAAALIKSWDFGLASIALAAMNSYYNTYGRVSALTKRINPDMSADQKENAFVAYKAEAAGKKVATIGHFAYVERHMKDICTLSILERNPLPGDYPDSAAEYILPQQDMVFITGCTITNKTLTRLLTLSKNARTIITGPSTPMTDRLIAAGADDLAGFIPLDYEGCKQAVLHDEPVFPHGKKARLFGKECSHDKGVELP